MQHSGVDNEGESLLEILRVQRCMASLRKIVDKTLQTLILQQRINVCTELQQLASDNETLFGVVF